MPSVMLAPKVRICPFLGSYHVYCSKNYIKIGSYLYLLESHYGSFDLEIDVLTLKMIWNHGNNTRNGFSSQKYTEKEVLHLFPGKLVRNIIFDLENHFFAYLTLIFTF